MSTRSSAAVARGVRGGEEIGACVWKKQGNPPCPTTPAFGAAPMPPTLRTTIAGATAALLTIAFAPAIEQAATADELDPHVASTNVELVTQLRYPELNGGDPDNVDEQGGTDLEVGSQTVLDEQGNEVERDFVYGGTYRNGFQLVDVTDPENPELVDTHECNLVQGDIQVMTRPDIVHEGTGLPSTFVTYAIDGGSSGLGAGECFESLQANNSKAFFDAGGNGNGGSLIFDVTVPTDVQTIGFIPAPGDTHNGTIRGFETEDGGTDWLFYNSENDAGGNLSIFDINDPTNVQQVGVLTLAGSSTDTHDVTFNEDGTRAYVASIVNTYILDTTDPRNPTVVTRIQDPGNGIHHQADPITLDTPLGERTYVIISDEIAGAAGNGYCPGGGMHIWDVTTEEAPVKVGAYFMPDIAVNEGANTGVAGAVTTCTSHVFRLYQGVGEDDRSIMTIGNMAGGVRVIDVSELIGLSAGHMNTSTGSVAGMSDLGWWRFTGTGEDGSDSWAFKAHADRFEEDGSFYAFSNDQTRGLEVYRFDGSAEVATPRAGQEAERGRMATNAEAVQRWASLEWRDDAYLYSCRFPGGIGGGLGTGAIGTPGS